MVRSLALLPALSLVLLFPDAGRADVLCTKKSGAVVRRTACKKKEAALDLSQFGALGPKGDPGDPGPSAVYVNQNEFANGLTNAFLLAPNPIASLSLPAGTYVVIGKTYVSDFDTNSSSNELTCQIRTGGSAVDESIAELGRLATGVFLDTSTLTVTAAVTLAADDVVTLNCANNGAANSSANSAKLMAIRTGSIVTQ